MRRPSGRGSRRDRSLAKILALEKIFILDTSVLLHDPGCLNKFHGHGIVVPIWAIEELDKFKSRQDLIIGKNARHVSNLIDDLRIKVGDFGSLQRGVPTASGGLLFVDFNGKDFSLLPIGLERNNDNRILMVAKHWQKTYPELKVILVSKDTNLRIKADACGVAAQDYISDKIVTRKDQLYTGYIKIELPPEASYFIEEFEYLEPGDLMNIGRLGDLIDVSKLYPNHCCRIEADGKYALAIYKKEQGALRKVANPVNKNKSVSGVHPINDRQSLAYGMMSDPDIKLVTLIGVPGSGKTLMSMLAGYRQSEFSRIAVFRPTHEASKDLGTLPGNIGGKMEPWAIPIIDVFNFILRRESLIRSETTSINNSLRPRKAKKRSKKSIDLAGPSSRMTNAKQYIEADRLEISPINFLRGRTFWSHEFVVVDEGQNFTPKEAEFIITRAGEGCKMVIEGDTSQIDNPYVDITSCGLTYIAEEFKEEELTGHITLSKGERSLLANMIARKSGS